jgi:hypothetical protein
MNSVIIRRFLAVAMPYTSRLTLGMHYASVHFSRVSVSFYTSVPPSLFALPQALHASHLFHRMARPAGEKKEPSLPPSISYKFPLPIRHAKRLESHTHAHVSSIRTMPKGECASQPANQPICKNSPNSSYTHPQNPIIFLFPFTIPFLFHSIATQISYLHPTSTLLHVRQVLPARRVPRRHVLLHAVGVAGRFARRQGGAGGRDAAVEAVFVEFLRRNHAISFECREIFDWMNECQREDG